MIDVSKHRAWNSGRLSALLLFLVLCSCQPVYLISLFPPRVSSMPLPQNQARTAVKSAAARASATPAMREEAIKQAPENPAESSALTAPAMSATPAAAEAPPALPASSAPGAPSSARKEEPVPEPSPPVLTLGPEGNPTGTAPSKERAQGAVDQAVKELGTVDRTKLKGQNATDYDLVAGFIKGAQEALKDEDFVRAQSLAEKAAALAAQLGERLATPH